MRKINFKRTVSFSALSLVSLLFAQSAIAATSTSTTTISTTVLETISVTCGATLALGNLTAGTPVSNTATCTTTTNANGGYDLAVKRDDADTTIDQTTDATTNITDKTAWNSSTPNGATWTGTGLGFRVNQTGTTAALYNSTWWGANDVAAALFAGFPPSYTNIASTSTYSSTATDVVIQARVDVSGTQKSGAYNGTVTFQGTSKP
ncbi:MAG: hypothetical protein HGA61_01685 [Candidatus Moranbacteria bacterium]|nr:hypothetical protein [Candidatus Moranbacteria bacterium]